MTSESLLIVLILVLSILLFITNKNSKHRDEKQAIQANHHEKSISQNHETIKKLEERINTLSFQIDSLKTENSHLREELNKQQNKLDYYLNIDESAGNLASQDMELSVSSPVHEKSELISEEGVSETTAKLSEQNSFKLDDEQQAAYDFINYTNNNVFITGKAGTGKSFLLSAFRYYTKKRHIILAPTGISALNIDGVTLHSFFGFNNLEKLNVDEINQKTLQLNDEKRSILQSVETIVIDEISMVRVDIFEKIDQILKAVNCSDAPFGGKQIVIFGDLFQLPPVVKSDEREYLLAKYKGIFFFHSGAYKAGQFKCIELTINHRQKEDSTYFEILNRIREGTVTDDDINTLNTRYTPDEDIYDINRPIALYPRRDVAEKVNREHLSQLASKEYIYNAKVLLDLTTNKTKQHENSFPVYYQLPLRMGATVMMVSNDAGHRWVNGTLGVVKKLTEKSITVSFGEGKIYDVQPCEFYQQEAAYSSSGKITYRIVYSILQYPLVPAYAITIHKAQGKTFNSISCDITKTFANGQAYVALSRCRSLEGLYLKNRITAANIMVDQEVLRFYREEIHNL